MNFSVVDVSELEPPQPMTVILTALARLAAKHYLLVKHRRQPFPLYEKLLEQGWAYSCQVHADDNITLYIYRDVDQALFDEQFLRLS